MTLFSSLLAVLVIAFLATTMTRPHVANARQSASTSTGQTGNFAATMDPYPATGEEFLFTTVLDRAQPRAASRRQTHGKYALRENTLDSMEWSPTVIERMY